MLSSSKSLTAVTSFVSVIRDKTVLVLRLNVKGCQRVGVPIAIIVSCLLSVGLFVAAGATDQMVKLSVKNNGTNEDKGDLHFSLFRGAHSILQRRATVDDEPDTADYLIYNVYETDNIIGVYATTVAVGLTILLCAATAALAFFNTFGVYFSWLYGPPMIYILAVFTAFMAALSLGVVSDFYLWDLDESSSNILRASLPSNLKYLADNYTTEPSFQYSFWLLFGGSLFPLLSFLLSWRLLVLLPGEYHIEKMEKSTSEFEMADHDTTVLDTDTPAHIYY